MSVNYPTQASAHEDFTEERSVNKTEYSKLPTVQHHRDRWRRYVRYAEQSRGTQVSSSISKLQAFINTFTSTWTFISLLLIKSDGYKYVLISWYSSAEYVQFDWHWHNCILLSLADYHRQFLCHTIKSARSSNSTLLGPYHITEMSSTVPAHWQCLQSNCVLFPVALQPNVGHCLLFLEASRSHTTHHSW